MEKIIAALIMIVSSAFVAVGVILLKKGTEKINIYKKTRKFVISLLNLQIILGIVCYVIASLIYVALLKNQNLSFLFPLASMNYIFVTIFSVTILKEKMNKYKWTGLILIIIGVVVITL